MPTASGPNAWHHQEESGPNLLTLSLQMLRHTGQIPPNSKHEVGTWKIIGLLNNCKCGQIDMYHKQEISVQLCFSELIWIIAVACFRCILSLHLEQLLLLVYRSLKACHSLSLVGQQKVKKETTSVISRVTSTAQGSAPPMEKFRVLHSTKAEGSCKGRNIFTSVTCAYEV